jgi:hypothetical protein
LHRQPGHDDEPADLRGDVHHAYVHGRCRGAVRRLQVRRHCMQDGLHGGQPDERLLVGHLPRRCVHVA